jgi:hypothetical protein
MTLYLSTSGVDMSKGHYTERIHGLYSYLQWSHGRYPCRNRSRFHTNCPACIFCRILRWCRLRHTVRSAQEALLNMQRGRYRRMGRDKLGRFIPLSRSATHSPQKRGRRCVKKGNVFKNYVDFKEKLERQLGFNSGVWCVANSWDGNAMIEKDCSCSVSSNIHL